MKKSYLLGAACVCLSVTSFNAGAVIIDNGTYTTDMATGIDWLDFDGGSAPTTVLRSYDQVSAEFVSGGDYEGWRYANRAEVRTFIQNITGVTIPAGTNTWSNLFEGITDEVAAYTGYTSQNSGVDYVYGITGDLQFTSNRFMAQLLDGNTVSNPGKDKYSELFSVQKSGTSSVTGSWLVRDVAAVPVPAAVWLFGSGLLGLVGMARRKKA